MIRLDSGTGSNPVHFHGVYIPCSGRHVWAQNWQGAWVCQVMHNLAAPVSEDEDDIERARYVDEILARREIK